MLNKIIPINLVQALKTTCISRHKIVYVKRIMQMNFEYQYVYIKI